MQFNVGKRAFEQSHVLKNENVSAGIGELERLVCAQAGALIRKERVERKKYPSVEAVGISGQSGNVVE